ncbi:alpha-ketoglutarate-dependent dioxygenase AlkB family protein [Noviherbaspirillum aridicola]|uniref:Alpha-ketoglutarate-dependent dioxygenase AlkB n=1 Tax=Noviherbaspirillum aridicola TaxID=2849687 RepID=A0ABQ4PYX8_9BURK|nr:alpha-ketoglutarate-dependent dioxygenase AlkB [Noviherbaspirillum aridicola]GIZ50030.1 alpha-ketoglutarate-dependent dioxygenase AlkB [Noviherbaspirillum aridicola]
MMDLCDDGKRLQPVPLQDAALHVATHFYGPEESAALMHALREEIAWRQERILIGGRERLQPRLSAWYGDAGRTYRYSGRRFEPLPWTPVLLRVRADVERATGHRYNSVLLNLYRNENDSVGWHSDDEAELGSAPAIASVSFGETRRFRLRHRRRKDLDAISIPLENGSLLLMEGPTQSCWRHAVPKETQACGPRINLTFRLILD